MKKLSLLLCGLLILSMLCSCQKEEAGGKPDKTTVTDKTSAGADPTTPQSTTAATNGGQNGGVEGTYVDTLAGLPYTIECRDYYNPSQVIDYTFTDEGRLNDGIYRSQAELENGTGEDKKVTLSDIRRYRVQITFESDGTQTGDCLVLQNCAIGYFLDLEMGPDLDNLTAVEVEQDYETPTGAHITELIKFDPTPIRAVRVTLIVQSRSDIVLDEIAIIDTKAAGNSVTTTTTTEPTIPTATESRDDVTTTTSPTVTTTRPTSGTQSTTPHPTNNGEQSIVGRWIQHVEGDNVEMSAWYSFFDDGTGSLITFAGLVTGELTYTYNQNGRYTITIEAKLFGQTDSDVGSGYMYVEGDYLYVVNDDDETTTLRRMTDEEYETVAEIAQKVGVRF